MRAEHSKRPLAADESTDENSQSLDIRSGGKGGEEGVCAAFDVGRCDRLIVEEALVEDWAQRVRGGGRFNVTNDMRIAQEEVFGPVLSVIPFDTEEEAIAIGNDINFGLAAGVWTQNLGRAMRVSDALNAGTVWVNTYRAVGFNSPFGGWKRSGLGRESGIEGLMEYVQTKSVWIAQESSVANPFIMR